MLRQLRRTAAAMRRAEAGKARTDTRAWAVERRARTRQLIELGGLVAKAGLDERLGGDRAALLGALLELADRLHGPHAADAAELWRRRGRRAFEADDEDEQHTPARRLR